MCYIETYFQIVSKQLKTRLAWFWITGCHSEVRFKYRVPAWCSATVLLSNLLTSGPHCGRDCSSNNRTIAAPQQ
ncbi:hypothetical protein J6590_048921 [Homalodisca vitripennis]|nr:hypothetical protein J6590_048921 [Homalodisca vitripennis]